MDDRQESTKPIVITNSIVTIKQENQKVKKLGNEEKSFKHQNISNLKPNKEDDNLSDECEKFQILIQALDQIQLESISGDDQSDEKNIKSINGISQKINETNQSTSIGSNTNENDLDLKEQQQIESLTKNSSLSFDMVVEEKNQSLNRESPIFEQFEIIPDDQISKESLKETSKQSVVHVEKVIPIPRERKLKSLETQNEMIEQKQQSIDFDEIKSLETSESFSRKPHLNDKDYPDDLNPFGEDDEDKNDKKKEKKNMEVNELTVKQSEENTKSSLQTRTTVIQVEEYPDDLNPFDDDYGFETPISHETNSKPNRTSSLNPFGSESEDNSPIFKVTGSSPKSSPTSTRRSSYIIKTSTPTKKKKRPAPLPPPVWNKSSQSLDHQDTSSNMYDSLISTASSNADIDESHSIGSIADIDEKSRTPTPTPRRSKIDKMNKSSSSSNLSEQRPEESSISSSCSSVQAQLKAIKNKKRPAPPIPAFKRELKTSFKDMDDELNRIGNQLPSIETERFQLEQWLLDYTRGKDSLTKDSLEVNNQEPNDDNSEYVQKLDRFLDLAKQKCKLGRKQKELMYMKREIKLEETQLELEYQLRVIMSKQDAQKTDEDRLKEQCLLNQMMEIVEERNDIIENMIHDENKEIEEYKNMVEKVVPHENSQEINQTPDKVNWKTSVEFSKKSPKHHHLKKFLKLKKLKKFKTKIKQNHQSNLNINHDGDEDDDQEVGDDKSSTSEDINSTGSQQASNIEHINSSPSPTPSGQTSTTMNSGNKEKKPKRKDLATLSRTTLKKFSNPSKTFLMVSNELKSKLQSNSDHNHHYP